MGCPRQRRLRRRDADSIRCQRLRAASQYPTCALAGRQHAERCEAELQVIDRAAHRDGRDEYVATQIPLVFLGDERHDGCSAPAERVDVLRLGIASKRSGVERAHCHPVPWCVVPDVHWEKGGFQWTFHSPCSSRRPCRPARQRSPNRSSSHALYLRS